MPVTREISLNLTQDEVLRREGFSAYDRIRSEIQSQISQLLETVNNSGLLQPVTTYEIYEVVSMDPDKVMLTSGAIVNGTLLPSTFPEACKLAVMVSTIGPGLENRVTEYSKNGETLHAMLLDGIGSAAVDILVQEACHLIAVKVAESGQQVGSPVNPGMPGLPIEEQRNILDLAHADEIGVSLTASGIMVPRKSTSLIMAIGPNMRTWTQEEVCARCNLRDTCLYKTIR
jgi:hypothetical protein